MPNKNLALGCGAVGGSMQRTIAQPWIWQSPTAPEPQYAVMRWKGGSLYAGPADSALAFPPELVEGSSMLVCSRAEALRHAVMGKVQA